MRNLIILGLSAGLVVGGYHGYHAYKVYNIEQQLRAANKIVKPKFETRYLSVDAPDYESYAKLDPSQLSYLSSDNERFLIKLKGEVLNQYPNYLIYITLPGFTKERFEHEQIGRFLVKYTCDNLEKLRDYDQHARLANLNVLEKDNVHFKYTVRNELGQVFLEQDNRIANCPQFEPLKTYVKPKEIPDEAYRPHSPFAEEEAKAQDRKN
ncbi:hypothetical protein [Acinetobacter sp. c3-l95]|uniref:hypothetical protein n=1 Tax=Acinetobacter sp. c3-l95 TaxID=3342804 RepID=UPI0035B95B1C